MATPTFPSQRRSLPGIDSANSMNMGETNPGIDSAHSTVSASPGAVGSSPHGSPGGGGSPGGAGAPSNYDPTKPVSSGPLLPPKQPGEVEGTSFGQAVSDIYDENSMQVQAARIKAKEGAGGTGLLFSDIASRAGEGAAFDKAMQLAAPDVAFKQDIAKGREGYKQQLGLGEQSYKQQIGLGEQKFGQQKELNEQLNKYDTETRESIQGFERGNMDIANKFTEKMKTMDFSNDMQASLLNVMQNMLQGGMQSMTQLAVSGEATAAEVTKIQESLRNSLKTFTNIWQVSAGDEGEFDFSAI